MTSNVKKTCKFRFNGPPWSWPKGLWALWTVVMLGLGLRIPAGWGEEGGGAAKEKEQGKPKASAHEIAQWIAELGSEQYVIREEATKKLVALGELARPALAEALEKASLDPEAMERVKRILYPPPKPAPSVTDPKTGLTFSIGAEGKAINATQDGRLFWQVNLGEVKAETLELRGKRLLVRPSLHLFDTQTGKLLSIGQAP